MRPAARGDRPLLHPQEREQGALSEPRATGDREARPTGAAGDDAAAEPAEEEAAGGTDEEVAEDATEIELVFPPADLPRETLLALLREGTLEPLGRLTAASNVTLLCRLTLPGAGEGGGPLEATCVHKPIRGERPLWDFPDGTLSAREVAAYELSEWAGFGVVPPTVLREGPFGPGMAQLWVDLDEAAEPLALVRADDPRLRRLALFDAVVNNGDRKVGHLLPTADGAILGCDHGVTFHVDPKLRTVLWAWVGEPFDAGERELLEGVRAGLDGSLGTTLAAHLAADELAATRERVEGLLARGSFPEPSPDWPAIPWPWY